MTAPHPEPRPDDVGLPVRDKGKTTVRAAPADGPLVIPDPALRSSFTSTSVSGGPDLISRVVTSASALAGQAFQAGRSDACAVLSAARPTEKQSRGNKFTGFGTDHIDGPSSLQRNPIVGESMRLDRAGNTNSYDSGFGADFDSDKQLRSDLTFGPDHEPRMVPDITTAVCENIAKAREWRAEWEAQAEAEEYPEIPTPPEDKYKQWDDVLENKYDYTVLRERQRQVDKREAVTATQQQTRLEAGDARRDVQAQTIWPTDGDAVRGLLGKIDSELEMQSDTSESVSELGYTNFSVEEVGGVPIASPMVGYAPTTTAAFDVSLWLTEWSTIMNKYTSKVWGNVATDNSAVAHVEKLAKALPTEIGQDGSASLSETAISRLQLVLAHLSAKPVVVEVKPNYNGLEPVGNSPSVEFHKTKQRETGDGPAESTRRPRTFDFDCPWYSCHQRFRNLVDLELHKATKHTSPLPCVHESCDALFDDLEAWETHVGTNHHGVLSSRDFAMKFS